MSNENVFSKENKIGLLSYLKQRFWPHKRSSLSCSANTPNVLRASESSDAHLVSCGQRHIDSPGATLCLSENSSLNNSYSCDISRIHRPNASEPFLSCGVSQELPVTETSKKANKETKIQTLCESPKTLKRESHESVIVINDTSSSVQHENYNAINQLNTSQPRSQLGLGLASLPNEREREIENKIGVVDSLSCCHASGQNQNGLDLKSCLMHELLRLSKYGWYWGSISKEEAEEKLTDQPDGSFLLRDSSHFLLSLSFRSYGKTLHTRIQYSLVKGLFSFYEQSEESFSTIAELIEHSMSSSKSAIYCYSRPKSPGHPAFPVRLTRPVSRFAHVQSLQRLCRFVIRESIRLDNIQKLPIPQKIKMYIEEGHY